MITFPDANNWQRDDYHALIRAANAGAFRPQDWLCIATSESGLRAQREYVNEQGKRVRGTGPFAQYENKNGRPGARGLTQMMPATLNNLGWRPGNPDYGAANGDYRELPIVGQIAWSARYLAEWRGRYKLKAWNSAGNLYLANFMPAHLPHKDNPDHVLARARWSPYYQTHPTGAEDIARSARIYDENSGFDAEKKGHIAVADVTRKANCAKEHPPYRVGCASLTAVRQLRLNECLPNRESLVIDGAVGPRTLGAVKAYRYAAGLPLIPALDDALDQALFGTA